MSTSLIICLKLYLSTGATAIPSASTTATTTTTSVECFVTYIIRLCYCIFTLE